MIKETIKQFFKFLIVGLNNTALDFLILNLLMFTFNLYQGLPIIFFNLISFTIAVTNSYLVNRFWTFQKEKNKKIFQGQFFLILIIFFILINLKFFKKNIIFITLGFIFFTVVLWIDLYIIKKFLLKERFLESSKEFGKFAILTILGMAINTSIFYTLTSFVSPIFGFSKILWANFSKAVATSLSLFWNFACYKLIVFNKKQDIAGLL
ncbi:MAG: GtrA family protein [Patescibacteria group bacterium]|nr:GtrA family protein [Patescibacteria group bacterium]